MSLSNFQAFPLARGEFTWNQEDLSKCDYNCRVNSCHHGCHDLDEPLSKCETRCTEEGITFDSCAQGCHAVEHAFLVQVQELLYQITVTIDALDESLRLRWQFPEALLAQVQEVAAADVGWYAQSRPSDGKTGWRWTALPPTAFRNSTLSTEINIPFEPTTHLQVHLVYRNRVGVSRAITYQMPLRVVPSRLEISSQLQVAVDKVAICWKAEASMVSSNIIQPAGKSNFSSRFPIQFLSTGTHLLQMRNTDDYIVSEEPLAIPFEIPEGDSITSVEGISSTSLVVGSNRGSVWLLSLEYNDTVIYTTPTVIRQSDEVEHSATQIEYDSMQNAIYVVLNDKGIARCTLENPSCYVLPNSDSLNPIRTVYWQHSSFLYFLGADHQVYRSELLPFEKVENYQLSTVTPFTGNLLFIYLQFLLLIKLFTLQWTLLIHTPVRQCSDIGLQVDKMEIVDFAILSDAVLPPTLTPPEKIGLVMSDLRAKISWIPPVNLPFQACPGSEYTASVRVCWNSVCSPFVNVINTAFAALKYPPVAFLRRSNDATTAFDLLGDEMQADCDVVYHRVSEPGEVFPFTSFLSVKFLTLLASRAVLVLATSYQIVSYRLTGTFYRIFSCSSPFEECPEIIGLSSDDTSGEIHYLFLNGTTVLYELNQEDRTPRPLATSTDLMRQLLVTNNKVIFVTQRGRVGQSDKKLGSLNVNYALGDVNTVVPVNPTDISNRVEIQGKYFEGQGTELVVDLTSFQISLYKDKLFVGDAHTAITTLTKMTLPSELLQSWSSAQRFDVSIAGSLSPTLQIGLQAPLKPPTAPTNVRLYATQQKTVDGARAIISLFWSPPLQWNATPFQYIINCTKVNSNSSYPIDSQFLSTGLGKCMEDLTSEKLKPLVRLFAIDSTNALIAITNVTQDEPVSKREKRQISHMEYQAIAFIGNDLFAVRKEHDSLQPVLVQIDTNDIDNIVHKVSIGGDVSRVDTMTSDWVGHRLLLVSGQALYQLPLDAFLTTSLLTPRKLIELSTGATDAKQLTFDPFKNTAYLLTRNGSLFLLNLARSHEKNLALAVPCLTSQTVTWMMTEFAWNRASSPKIYALTWNGLIVIDVEENNKCNEVRIDWNKFGEKGLKAMSAFAIADKLFVFVTSSEMLIYGRETVVPIPITYPPLRQILAVSQSSQPYPDRSCFTLPSSAGIQFTVVNEGKTGAFLEVSKPPPPNICHGVSLPQTHYEVYFTRKNTDKVKHIRSYTEKIHVENGILDKETDYEVTVAWLNRYSDASGISDAKSFRTGFGYPSAPRSLQAIAVTPDTIYLYWNLPETLNAPIAEIKYKISQQASGLASPSSIAVQEYSDGMFSPTTSDSASCLVSPCRAKVANLRPATEYRFWATSIHKSHLNSQFLEDAEAISQEASARTKDIPGTLRPDNVTGSSLLLRWNSLQAEQPPSVISVQYKETGSTSGWKSPSNASFDPSVSTILVLINGLLSATSYDYRFVAAYSGSITIENRAVGFKEYYYQGVQQAKTKAGVPTAPQQVEARMDEEGWIVLWKEPSSDGGSPITSYAVEMRHNRSAEWEIAERGLDGWKLWWRPAKSDRRQTWEFRVRAANLEGFGAYGYSTDTVGEFGTLIETIRALHLIIVFHNLLVRARARASRLKKERNLDKNCITLEKIAGLDQSPCQPMPPEMLNEIKSLIISPDAIDFSNFDHPNIVKLLGVCLEGPKEYLILELMEGGDLLNFLKASSPTDSYPSQLSLRDVLSMLIDIGRGGAYLESIRHVHRDLAARNCLISSRTSRSNRVTKIGAMSSPGMSTHSRWLAPECIMEGMFSSKSDIWAFGILMYEIVSLGQKPYLNMDNNQVLTHVRNGGTPPKPVYYHFPKHHAYSRGNPNRLLQYGSMYNPWEGMDPCEVTSGSVARKKKSQSVRL
ncbi:unnamed protein product [Haemonchus placei]|uniref:Receptor protein-tyrosine kinase n=1 Tax=Haemonchus placei TaxID=6290 RepID=A0A3P7WLH4_HAEPC|nr:unnamed protein product [Haemonchus placei]